MRKILLVFLVALFPAYASEQVINHLDRSTPQVVFNPQDIPHSQGKNVSKEQMAIHYLETNWQRYDLQPGAVNLELVREQQSLLGSHYTYQQMYQGVPVDGGQVVVSVLDGENRIYQIYNNAYPEPAQQQKAARMAHLELDSEEALDLSWEHLRVHGRLTAMPETLKVWKVVDGNFQLIWRNQIIVDEPNGVWSVEVDAMTGKILRTQEVSQSREPYETPDFAAYEGPITDRVSDTKRLAQFEADREAARAAKKASSKRAQGSGNTFDPDPLTTLNTSDLFDTSPAAAFADAYIVHDLLDITETNGVFELVGPWVYIDDFFQPFTAPSTTTDGVWDFFRGNNAFNDANTYFHIDQNQRYIQSIGFTGDRAIQNASIQVDTDGWSGIDNSRYTANSTLSVNRLEFGHGCVDDNEDADVILHEYGHGLHRWINPSWVLGNLDDVGGIGEGFCDYWAGSYSYKTPNGPVYRPEFVYTWDGPVCWGGRFLNLTNLQYDPSRTYADHASIPGGSSDELWSAPLFASMLDIEAAGHPLSDADTVILQSHFGMGPNPRMNVLAQSTVNAAELLFPDGPHAGIFNDNFNRQNFGTSVSGGGGPTTYGYISAHVPPDNDWINEIHIINPGATGASITARVYELVDGSYTETDSTPLTLAGGASMTFSPAGTAQRWVHFESSQPLSGTSFFSRTVEGRGEEKAGIPLFKESGDLGTSLIIPHIPADRNFFSGAVVLNPNDSLANLSYEFYDANGDQLLGVQTANAPTSLDPNQKWVGFLAPFGDLPSVFDDETNGGDLVSWLKISSDQPLAAFELFGYKATSDSPLATAGIQALPDHTHTTYPVRTTLTNAIFTSFSMLNPDDADANVNLHVVDREGSTLGDIDVTIPARTKVLGLNINDPDNADLQFFRAPFPNATLDLANPADVAQVIVTGAPNLRIFELTGSGTSELDGGAVTPASNQVSFAKASGLVEIFKVAGAGNVTITGSLGTQTSTDTLSMVENELRTITLGNENASILDTFIVTGENISVTLISRNEADGSIAVVNGSSTEQAGGN